MKRILLSVVMMAIITAVKAQVPQQLNYQGIARNSTGSPITYQNITVRLTIIDSALGGQISYRETRRVQTNYVGLFNIIIGSSGATNITGRLQDVNWPTGQKYIKLEIDPNGFNDFSVAGITQLQSVPYALSASPAGSAGEDLTGSYPSPGIANNAITNNKIANGSISLSKLDPVLAANFGNKLDIADTASMLSSYARTQALIDSLTLVQNRMNLKLNIADTASMLAPYVNASTLNNSIATKLNTADTSSMLGSYARAQRMIDSLNLVQSRIDLKLNIADTASMLAPYANASTVNNSIATKLNISDTATMLNSYARTQRMIDSLNLVQSRINLKLNIADTASMLAPYANASTVNNSIATKLNIADTASMLSSYARTQRMIDSLTLVQSRINLKLNIADTASMLSPYATVANSTSGLNLKVNISDTAAMLSSYTRTQRMIDSLTLVQNRLDLKLNLADTAAMLNPYYLKSASVSELATKENVANKSTDIVTDAASDTKYPSVKTVKDYVDAASTGNSTALASEIANRINADDSIKNNVATETTRATNSENTLATNLSAEVTNRTNADDSIKNNLATEIARATAAEATKENTANKSTVTALGTSDVLFPTQNAVKTYVDAASTGNSTALASEIINRINADDSIKNNLAIETARATNSENTLATNLSAEVTNRINADDSIKNNLTTETARATAAETLLGTTKENTANKSTATALGTSDVLFPTQNAVKTYVDAASTGNSTALASEIINRINADDSIKNNLAIETARATNSENTLATNLSAEVTNRTNADDSIKNNLAA